jgi:hypothetical protein
MRVTPWKSGASAPRKSFEISGGFSPCSRILCQRRLGNGYA